MSTFEKQCKWALKNHNVIKAFPHFLNLILAESFQNFKSFSLVCRAPKFKSMPCSPTFWIDLSPFLLLDLTSHNKLELYQFLYWQLNNTCSSNVRVTQLRRVPNIVGSAFFSRFSSVDLERQKQFKSKSASGRQWSRQRGLCGLHRLLFPPPFCHPNGVSGLSVRRRVRCRAKISLQRNFMPHMAPKLINNSALCAAVLARDHV